MLSAIKSCKQENKTYQTVFGVNIGNNIRFKYSF